MLNDPSRTSPRCRFHKEHEPRPGEDSFEDDVPVPYLSAEIVRRTESVVGKKKDKVSAKPIILR